MTDLKGLRRIGEGVTDSVAARVNPETKQWLIEYCARERVTVSAIVAKLIEEFRKENG